MQAIRISKTMVEIPLSEHMVEAIKRIAKVDFNDVQCVDSKRLLKILQKLENFRDIRTNAQFGRYMEFYRLFDIVDGVEYNKLIDTLNKLHSREMGCAVRIQG